MHHCAWNTRDLKITKNVFLLQQFINSPKMCPETLSDFCRFHCPGSEEIEMHIFLGHPVITSNTNIAVKVNINTFQSPGFPECFKLSGKGGAVEGQDLGIVLTYPRSDFSSLQISKHKKLKTFTVIKILYI